MADPHRFCVLQSRLIIPSDRRCGKCHPHKIESTTQSQSSGSLRIIDLALGFLRLTDDLLGLFTRQALFSLLFELSQLFLLLGQIHWNNVASKWHQFIGPFQNKGFQLPQATQQLEMFGSSKAVPPTRHGSWLRRRRLLLVLDSRHLRAQRSQSPGSGAQRHGPSSRWLTRAELESWRGSQLGHLGGHGCLRQNQGEHHSESGELHPRHRGSEAKASTTGRNGEKKALSPTSLTPCSANFSWMATTPAGSSGNSNPAGLTQQIQGHNFDRRIMRTEGMAIRLGFSLRRERSNERPTQGALASGSRALRHSPGC